MDAQLAKAPNGDATVVIKMDPAEAQQFVSDLTRATELLGIASHEDDASRARRTESLAQLVLNGLQQVGVQQLANATSEATNFNQAVHRCGLPELSKVVAGNIPPEHVEWALKVYKLTASHSRASEHPVLERVFPKGEDEARKFFTQTQNIWNMRVRGKEAPAFNVVLGVQDARKHKKKGSFGEITHALCTGQVEAVNPDPPTG